jgi:hypothetical protein
MQIKKQYIPDLKPKSLVLVSKAETEMLPNKNLDRRKKITDQGRLCVYSKRAHQELTQEARTSGFEGRDGTQEALSGE